MTGGSDLLQRLCDRLLRAAGKRMKGEDEGEDWADAMRAELQSISGPVARLQWAFGCWRASFSAPGALDGPAYAGALALGVALLISHQWLADEGLATLGLLGVIATALGLLRPNRAWVSGGVAGLVVSAVLMFEVVSGWRPGYEQGAQTLGECLHWLILAPLSLLAAAVGAWLRGRLDPLAGR